MASQWLYVAAGGAIGAILRFYVGQTMSNQSFPAGTLTVNLVGSFLLGALMMALSQSFVSQSTVLFVGVGILGAFTTMSTFSVEMFTLLQANEIKQAASYYLITIIACPILAWLGWKSISLFA